MYQYSLQWYTQLFVYALNNSEKSESLDDRLKILEEYFTYYLYVSICRSLFEKHKLLFSFLVSIQILTNDGRVNQEEYMFLLTGKTTNAKELDNPAPEWINKRGWNEILCLASLPAFANLETLYTEQVSSWKRIFDSLEPHNEELPAPWNGLNLLQKMCLLRTTRADKMVESIQTFVSGNLGSKFVEPPPFDLESCYADSSPTVPLIFVLVQGSDPSKEFYKFAASVRMDKKLKGLSLGQGQGPIATKMVQQAVGQGTWVYLQNCHLYSSWMPTLERLAENLNPAETHRDFRLWLTSMPSASFPVSILQNGVKMTNEPPKGLRANLKSAYFKLDDEKLKITTKPFEYRKLLFGLCLFHASVQERRKFGPLGWNIPYSFNDTDLEISKSQLEMFLDTYDFIPYKVLNFLTSLINYGGRVTDDKDIRTIDSIIQQFYNKSVIVDNEKICGYIVSVAADPETPHKSYVDYIDALPINAGPEIFGLHENASISCALDETYGTFATIMSMYATGGGGGGDRESVITQVAATIEARLPQEFNIEEIQMSYPVLYEESMNTVLAQECIRYNKLLAEMHKSLPALQKAQKGLVVLSSELEIMGNEMYANKVPFNWEAKAYPSLKPLNSWTDELIERVKFINGWIKSGTPHCFWISGFYFPQAFLTGSLQNYARKYHMPIDTVSFNYRMTDIDYTSFDSTGTDGVFIRGLFLEGARWDAVKGSLADSRPKQLYTEMPVIHLDPEQHRKAPTSGIYRCPVYKELSRRGTLSTTGHSTNFVLWIEIPGDEETFINNEGYADQRKWVMAGVAAFCALKF